MKLYGTFNKEIRELIKAQDMVRQVYVQHDGTEIEKKLRELDKEMSNIINLIGKSYEVHKERN